VSDWWIYNGTGIPHNSIERLPEPPPWRRFDGKIIERHLVEPVRDSTSKCDTMKDEN